MNTDKNVLERQLLSYFDADELKSIGEEIAETIRKHGLQHSADKCRLIFDYLSFVIEDWNSV